MSPQIAGEGCTRIDCSAFTTIGNPVPPRDPDNEDEDEEDDDEEERADEPAVVREPDQD